MEQEPESCEGCRSSHTVPLHRSRGTVELWVLGNQRYRVTAPSGEQTVEGYQQAREVAHELAAR
jgi:hypothetical protein